jgi:hypothetical protein
VYTSTADIQIPPAEIDAALGDFPYKALDDGNCPASMYFVVQKRKKKFLIPCKLVKLKAFLVFPAAERTGDDFLVAKIIILADVTLLKHLDDFFFFFCLFIFLVFLASVR